MTILQIDMIRYWELVQWKKNLETQGKSWWLENETQSQEWLRYQVIFSHQIYFESRNQYLPLIQKFVEKNLDPWEFYSFFLTLWYKDINQTDVFQQDWQNKEESAFSTDDRAKPFYDCIESIFDAGEEFSETDMTNVEEEQFRAEVTKIFDKIENLLEKA